MADIERSATTVWNGSLTEGSGHTKSATGVIDADVTWAARTAEPEGLTSPEELLASAHATCYAMAFSNFLTGQGNQPEQLTVTSTVTFVPKDGGGFKVGSSTLRVVGKVPGLNEDQFKAAAIEGEKGCPISNALRGNVEITVESSLA
jgi:osmotically inducible protein OsmC